MVEDRFLLTTEQMAICADVPLDYIYHSANQLGAPHVRKGSKLGTIRFNESEYLAWYVQQTGKTLRKVGVNVPDEVIEERRSWYSRWRRGDVSRNEAMAELDRRVTILEGQWDKEFNTLPERKEEDSA